MVGIPIGTDEYVLERAMEVMRDGDADHLARCLANMPDKQAGAHIAIESLGHTGQTTWKWLWTRCCPLKHAEGQTPGRSEHTKKTSSYREQRRHNHFSRRGARGTS